MNLQYVSDKKGKTTGVFIPIQEWEELKNKFKGLEEVEYDEQSKEETLLLHDPKEKYLSGEEFRKSVKSGLIDKLKSNGYL